MQAASTLNQSDIRGLVRHRQSRAYMQILRRDLLYSMIMSSVCHRLTYRYSFSTDLSYVPASANVISSKLHSIKLRRRGIKDYSYATRLAFLACISVIINHINPANSLAIATVATEGILPWLISL